MPRKWIPADKFTPLPAAEHRAESFDKKRVRQSVITRAKDLRERSGEYLCLWKQLMLEYGDGRKAMKRFGEVVGRRNNGVVFIVYSITGKWACKVCGKMYDPASHARKYRVMRACPEHIGELRRAHKVIQNANRKVAEFRAKMPQKFMSDREREQYALTHKPEGLGMSRAEYFEGLRDTTVHSRWTRNTQHELARVVWE